MSGIVVEEWKVNPRGGILRGFARIRMPSGVIYSGVLVSQQGEKCWASPPGIPQYGADGRKFLKDGKQVYQQVISFASKELRETFSRVVVEAVKMAHPEAFDNGGAQ